MLYLQHNTQPSTNHQTQHQNARNNPLDPLRSIPLAMVPQRLRRILTNQTAKIFTRAPSAPSPARQQKSVRSQPGNVSPTRVNRGANAVRPQPRDRNHHPLIQRDAARDLQPHHPTRRKAIHRHSPEKIRSRAFPRHDPGSPIRPTPRRAHLGVDGIPQHRTDRDKLPRHRQTPPANAQPSPHTSARRRLPPAQEIPKIISSPAVGLRPPTSGKN